MSKLARQADFDQIVKDVMESGSSLEEAVQEAVETFTESNYDLNSLFIYQNSDELQEKEKTDRRCKTIEDVANGKDTVVNLTFAIQGLLQTLNLNNKLSRGVIKLLESKKILSSLLKIMTNFIPNEDEDAMSNAEDDEDEEDEEENLLLQKIYVLDLCKFLLAYPSNQYNNYQDFCTLSEETIQKLCQYMDEDSGESKVMTIILDVIGSLLNVGTNFEYFTSFGLYSLLDLIKKMNKSNATIDSKVTALQTRLNGHK